MTWTPRRCASLGCEFWIPRPSGPGRPQLHCPTHAVVAKRVRDTRANRTYYLRRTGQAEARRCE